MTALSISGEQNGLHVTVYPGDNKILVAMSLDDALLDEHDKNVAGFAIWRKYSGKSEVPLANRINFTAGVSPRELKLPARIASFDMLATRLPYDARASLV